MLSALVYIALLPLPQTPPPALEGWPAALITFRLFEWYPILIGTAVLEALILRKIGDTDWKGAIKAAVAANALSSLAGIALLPLAGVAWKYTLNRSLESLAGIYGNYSLASWIGNVWYMAMLLGAMEALIISLVIGKKLSPSFVLGWIVVSLLPLLLAVVSFTYAPYDPNLL